MVEQPYNKIENIISKSIRNIGPHVSATRTSKTDVTNNSKEISNVIANSKVFN
jgi:hypothetical protein